MRRSRINSIVRTCKRPRAFTLVELLVGLLISTMILGAAAAAFSTMMSSWERGDAAYGMIQTARSVGDLIERQLRSAIDPESGVDVIFWGEDLSDGEIGGHRITLLSSAPVRFPRSLPLTDASEIEFVFDPSLAESMSMRIDSSPDDLPDGGGYRISLSENVVAFQVMYFDGEEWLEDWLTSGLPQAIEFTVTFVKPETGKEFQISRLVALPLAIQKPTTDLNDQTPADTEQSSASQNGNDVQGGTER